MNPKLAACALALMTLSSASAAPHKLSREDFCEELTLVYVLAASGKQAEFTPQQIYQSPNVQQTIAVGLSPATVKQAINNAYFKKAFDLPPDTLSREVSRICLNGEKTYTPLK